MPKPTTPIEMLLADLRSSDVETRDNAARELGKTRDPRAVDALMLILGDADWKIRRNAAQALGATKDKRAVELLIGALQDRTMTVRSRAAVALGRLKDARAVDPLIEAWLNAPNSELADHVIAALQKLGAAAFPALKQAYAANPDQRAQLLSAFGGIKHPEALNVLVTALRDENPKVRMAAARALTQIKDRRAIEPLRAALSENDMLLQDLIVRALAKLGAVEAVPEILALLDNYQLHGSRALLYQTITETMQQFGDIPRPSGKIVHTSTFRAGGTLTNDLSALLSTSISQMGGQLDALLKSMGMETSATPVANLASQMESMIESANRDGVTRLIFLLNAPQPLTRIGAALGLAWYMDGRALNSLRQATQDADANVRVAAQWALGVLEQRFPNQQ